MADDKRELNERIAAAQDEPAPEGAERTAGGVEVPTPKRGDFFGNLKKVSKPNKRGLHVSPKICAVAGSAAGTRAWPRRAFVCAVAFGLVASVGAGAGTTTACRWKLSPILVPDGGFSDVDARTAKDVWAVGDRRGATLAAHWDGKQWRVTPTPPGANTLTGVVATAANEAWAVGARANHALIERWNGTRWSIVRTPAVGASVLYGIDAASPDDVWAVGVRGTWDDGWDAPPLIEHWDGAQWRIVATPRSLTKLALLAVSVTADGEIWTPCLRSPDGRRWLVRRPPQVSASACAPSTIDAPSGDDAWASFGDGSILAWDGRRWHARPLPGARCDCITIAGFAVISRRDVWAAGYLMCCGGAYDEYLAHWNGVRWTQAKGALPYGTDNGVSGISAVSRRDVWAVGNDDEGGRIEHYTCSR